MEYLMVSLEQTLFIWFHLKKKQ